MFIIFSEQVSQSLQTHFTKHQALISWQSTEPHSLI